MTGLVVQHEVLRQRPQFAVRHFVTHQSPGQTQRVHHPIGEVLVASAAQRSVEEPQIETHVVPHDDGVTHELQQGRQHCVNPGSRAHHGLGDAGEIRDGGRDGHTGVHQRGQYSGALAPHVSGSGDLGDFTRCRRSTGGLQVDDAERDMRQRGAEIVE